MLEIFLTFLRFLGFLEAQKNMYCIIAKLHWPSEKPSKTKFEPFHSLARLEYFCPMVILTS